MNNLAPQKIVDKNGVLTTRHKRVTPNSSLASALPAPKLSPQKKQKAVPKSLLKSERFMSYAPDADPELLELLGKGKANRITTTANSVYDIYSVTSIDNTSLLIAHGITNRKDALVFLRDNGLERLFEDNSKFVDELIKYTVPAESVIANSVWLKNTYGVLEPRIEDEPELVAQSLKIASIKAMTPYGLVDAVRKKDIDYFDVRAIGASRFHLMHGHLDLAEELEKIKYGELPYTAKELAKIIDLANPHKTDYNVGKVLHAVEMARDLGGTEVSQLKHLDSIAYYYHTVQKQSQDKTEALECMKWLDQMSTRRRSYPDTDDILKLYRAGVSPEKVTEGMSEGLTANQIIAMNEGVSSSVASGWL